MKTSNISNLLAAAIFCCMLPTAAVGDIKSQLFARFDKAESSLVSQTERITEIVSGQMDRLIGGTKSTGNFDKMKELIGEKNKFEKSGRMPLSVDCLRYRQAMTKALEGCIERQNKAIALATKKREFKLAGELAKRRDKFQEQFEREFPGSIIRRIKWKHSNGRFERADENNWHEFTPNTRHAFVETGRDDSCVYLFDQSRNLRVVLGEGNCKTINKKGRSKTVYSGSWKD